MKIYTIFIVLICLPYLNFNIISVNYYFTIALCATILILLYPINLLKLLINIHKFHNAFYLFLFYCITNYSNNYNSDKIYLPYYINILSTNRINKVFKIKVYIKYYLHLLPKYLQKVFCINILNLILLKFLFAVTESEFILNTSISFFSQLNRFQYLDYSKCITIISFSFQFMQRIVNNLSNLYVSIKIKYDFYYLNPVYIFIAFRIIVEFLFIYIENLFENVAYATFILWNRKVVLKTFLV